MDVDFIVGSIVLLVLGGSTLAAIVWRVFGPRGAPASNGDRPSGFVHAIGEEPKCVCCPAPASRPVSRTRASTSWFWFLLREKLGLPMAYAQYLPDDAPLVLCDIHGRHWDAMLRTRRVCVIMTKRAKCDEEIAGELAVIETETLMLELLASLTKTQKASLTKTQKAALSKRGSSAGAQVISIGSARTGTDNEGTP